MRPFQVVKDFEAALCEYTGAPYAVTVNSCTMALFLALVWHRRGFAQQCIEIPRRTYISVPMQIKLAGWEVRFRDEAWSGAYRLEPTPVWDSARRFTSGMYRFGQYQCVSFHWNKPLGIQQGGAILHDNGMADPWFRRARFDGRTEGIPPKLDRFEHLGWHCYMSPEIAAEGLVRLSHLPKTVPDMPTDDYPDLSTIEIFK